MRSLTCIVCPIGCSLSVTEKEKGELEVTGNRCPRGAVYAVEEITAPKRVVTATCRLGPAGACSESASQDPILQRMRRHGLCDPRRLPVKTSIPCPKEYIDELLKTIYQTQVKPPVKRGDVIIKNWKNLGLDVVAARALD
ncbi:protein of unknown function DUF1667 [Gracilinema caldarium DSM 7334]|uniref:Molybdopterin oxidoreductase n=1 Tax=Gracilinema caldarium (strain ATCC 51460 / DSM 7334 / H1) TaxID=744872 RepID=F8F128_GRAC1|nr:protein of unknown function DUF1667 [Gracilinema caldarium DSM 7334]